MASIWNTLEIEETTDKSKIKTAYRKKLTVTNPEDHPEEFKALRAAYEEAMALADAPPKTEAAGGIVGVPGLTADETPVGLWLEKVSELYGSFYDRIDVRQWQRLLSDNVCVGLESAEQAREQLLKFFMDHIKLPNDIWKAVDETFDIVRDRQELYETFPKDYIEYIIRLIKYENFLDYHLFEGNDFADYDSFMDTYFDLRQAVNEKKWEQAQKLYEKLAEDEIYHPYIDVDRAIIARETGHTDQARELLRPVAQKYPDSFYIGNTYGELCMDAGDFAAARPVFEHLLEVRPENYDARLGLARCISAAGDHLQAKELVLDLLEISPGDDHAMDVLKEINEQLIVRYEKELKDSPMDLGISLDLGWCLCQNEDYDRCLSMMEQLTPDDAHQYDYTNLRGRIYLCLERYGDALPWLLRWKTMIEELTDDGTKEYRKRKKRLGYANYAIACSYAWMGEHTNKDYYQTALDYVEAAITTEKESRQRFSCIYTKAEILHKLGQEEACIDLCDTITDEESGYFPAYVLRQEAWLALGRVQKVVDEYYKAVRIYPYHPRPYEMAVQVFLDYQEPAEALEVLDSAKKAGVMNDELRQLKLRCLKNMADSREAYDKAIAYCDEVLALKEPERTKAWICQMYRLKAMCLMDSGRNTEAMAIISKAIMDYPSDNVNLVVKAEILENMEEDSQALKLFLELSGSMPDNAYICEHVSRIYMRRKDYKKALWYMKKVLALDARYPLVHRSLGLIHKAMIHSGDKESFRQAVLEFSTQIELSEAVFDLLERGKLWLAASAYDEAEKDFMRVQELEPDNKAAALCLGDVYYKSGAFEKALHEYEKIFSAAPEAKFTEEMYERMGGCYVELNRYSEARTYFELYRRLYPESAYADELLGNLYIKMKDYPTAARLFEHGMNQAGADRQYYASKICAMYIAIRDLPGARYWWKWILSEKRDPEHQFMGNIRAVQYYLYMDMNMSKASRFLKQATAAADRSDGRENLLQARYLGGVLEQCRDNAALARQHFDQSLDILCGFYPKAPMREPSEPTDGLFEDISVRVLRKLASLHAWLKNDPMVELLCTVLEKRSPSMFEVYMVRGIRRFADGNYAAASEWLVRARDTGGLDVECEGMFFLTEHIHS